MSISKIPSPYGFAPHVDHVVRPEWAELANHDVPLEGAICGRIDVEIQSKTPIFTRGSGDPSQPYQLPDGRWAFPGSGVRGAIRNVVEIASFSRLSRVNDHRYAVRDLHNRKLYGDHMAAILDTAEGKREPMPLVDAGWLVVNPEPAPGDPVARIYPTNFAKIEYELLTKLARSRGVANFDPGRKQSSTAKNRAWDGKRQSVNLDIRVLRPPDGRRYGSAYGKVTRLEGATEADLVFTGQPSNYDPNRPKRKGAGNPKHHDFVLWGSAGEAIDVRRDQFDDFLFAHSERGGQRGQLGGHGQPNEEWGYWAEQIERDVRAGKQPIAVPIFFLRWTDPKDIAQLPARGNMPKVGDLRAFGLAMMFRLPYIYSVKEARHAAHAEGGGRDFTETLFGFVGSEKPEAGGTWDGALKSRVGFDTFVAIDGKRSAKSVTAVLGTPKASYYPNYIEQDPNVGPGSAPQRSGYTTFMDNGALIRGFKRYRPSLEVRQPDLPTDARGRPLENSSITSTFQPLEAGTRFRGSIRVHNVLPQELGAILWALDFGKRPECFHMLGMARPLGYGASQMRIVGSDLSSLDGEAVNPDAARRAFDDYMEQQCRELHGGWELSQPVTELLALAEMAPAHDLRYPKLHSEGPGGEFSQAKSGMLSLRAVTDWIEWRREAANRIRVEPQAPQRSVTAETASVPDSSVEAILTGQSKKGNWKARLADGSGEGVVKLGSQPPGVATDDIVRVEIATREPRNSQIYKWKSQQ